MKQFTRFNLIQIPTLTTSKPAHTFKHTLRLTLRNKKQAWDGKIEKEKDEPVIYKCLTSADRGDEGCEEEEEEEEGDRKKNGEVKKEDSIRKDG